MHDTDEIMDPLDEVFDFAEGDGDTADFSEIEAETEPPQGNAEEPTQEAQPPETAETTGGVKNDGEAEEVGAEGSQEADKAGSEDEKQFISVKYDGETRNISLEDAPGLIQKGMNYERMQEKFTAADQEKQSLQGKLDEQAQTLETLSLIAQTIGVPVDKMLEQLHVNAVKSTGKTEAEAKAIIKADKLERQLRNQKGQNTQEPSPDEAKAQQVTRELADFRKQFPDISLEDAALVERLRPHIQSGMSLTAAYLKQENERQAAEIVRLQQEQAQKQAAQHKNQKNRTHANGSMQDSGGSRTKDLADLFEQELFR